MSTSRFGRLRPARLESGATLFTDDAAVRAIGEGLIARTLPKQLWTHEAHLAACLWIIRERPDIRPDQDLRPIISGYNEAVGGINDDTQGYHETITQCFIVGVRVFLAGTPATSRLVDLVNGLLESPFGQRTWPLQFYSEARIFSVEARKNFILPDIAAMPPP